MVEVELERKNGDFLMEAINDKGNKILMDAGPEDGGQDGGFRPMQLLLAALGGCSSIDVIAILRKQREVLKDLKITITGEKQAGVAPSLFTKVHAHFKLYGAVNSERAEKAIALSINKYCSVAKTLEKTAVVSYSFEIIPD